MNISVFWGADLVAYLPLASSLWGKAEEVVQDGEVAAEQNVLFLQDVLLEKGRDLVTKQSLVILPDLPLHLHGAGFIQILVSHHQLQLLLRHLMWTNGSVKVLYT